MSPGKYKYVDINGHRFRDVTDETTGEPKYNYAEAVALTEGRRIATGTIEIKEKRKPRP